MTAEGTLYIDEECRDVFEDKLNKWYGEDKWVLDGDDFGDYNLSNFPRIVEVDVKDKDDNIIGKVEIISEFYIEGDEERYIDISPKSIKRIK